MAPPAVGLILLALGVFGVEVLLQECWIRFSLRRRMSQVQKAYGPERHILEKGKTPSMGGVVFLAVPLMLAGVRVCRGEPFSSSDWVLWSLPLCVGFVGYWDDFLKQWRRSSEGLRSLQKLVLQLLFSLPWCVAVSWAGVDLWPGWTVPFPLALPLLLFVSTGIQNAVNVTDGLDGLAAGAMVLSLTALLPFVQGGVREAAVGGWALCAAFLWHNGHPARVFLGDGGAHFLAGLLLSLCVAARALVLVVPLGFLFGVEILSVSLQLVAIHRFGRRLFRMSPLHHHFELIGWPETRIVTRFWLVHLLGMGGIWVLFQRFWGGANG